MRGRGRGLGSVAFLENIYLVRGFLDIEDVNSVFSFKEFMVLLGEVDVDILKYKNGFN